MKLFFVLLLGGLGIGCSLVLEDPRPFPTPPDAATVQDMAPMVVDAIPPPQRDMTIRRPRRDAAPMEDMKVDDPDASMDAEVPSDTEMGIDGGEDSDGGPDGQLDTDGGPSDASDSALVPNDDAPADEGFPSDEGLTDGGLEVELGPDASQD